MTSKQFGSITVSCIKDILLLQMHGGSQNQSVFNPGFTKQYIEALDYVESIKGKRCLIITGTNQFFSAGIDLKYFQNGLRNEKGILISKMISNLLKKILILNMPTVAAINGHTFGVALFIALCCDWRLMKKSCGKLCMPALQLNTSPQKAWRRLIPFKLPAMTVKTTMLTGKQWTSKEALNVEMIDEEIYCENNEIFIEKCIAFASTLTRFAGNRANYSRIKKDLYSEIVKDLDERIDDKNNDFYQYHESIGKAKL
eukprot:267093_1